MLPTVASKSCRPPTMKRTLLWYVERPSPPQLVAAKELFADWNTPPQSHSPSTEALSETLASTNLASAAAPAETETPPPETADDGLDLGLLKKKKKKVKKDDDDEGAGEEGAAADDGGLGKSPL